MMRGRGRGGWLRALALGAALLLGWAMLGHAPAAARHEQLFPTLHPAALAHYLADFSNHALLYPNLESWAIESEWSNYTSWRYEVQYRCGAHCAGRVAVSAHAAHEPPPARLPPPARAPPRPRHGPAPRHRVTALDARCTQLLPPLPWPAVCEETEVDTLIWVEGAGARLSESASGRCSLAAVLLRRCPDGLVLRARTDRRLRAAAAALRPTETN